MTRSPTSPKPKRDARTARSQSGKPAPKALTTRAPHRSRPLGSSHGHNTEKAAPGVLPWLDHTIQLLKKLLPFKHPADSVISHHFREHKFLGARDRAALSQAAFDILRHRASYAQLAQSGSGPSERRLALLGLNATLGSEHQEALQKLLSADEKLWLERVTQIDPATLSRPTQLEWPAWLVEAMDAQLPPEQVQQLAMACNQSAPLDLRVNLLKASREEAMKALQSEGIQVQITPWSPWGLRVQGRALLEKSPTFKAGLIEVQDEGSQLLALLTQSRRGEMVADFCAGAGGKTLALGAMMRNTGRLYAFDTSGHRLDAIKPRLTRSGLSNVYPAQIAHERDERIKRLSGKLDRVLVDAPCSGLGTLRRNPDLKWRQNPKDMALLQQTQLDILCSAARLLKAGGQLVYATCSLLREENEAVAEAFNALVVEAGKANATVPALKGFEPLNVAEVLQEQHVAGAQGLVSGPYLRLWPHQHGTDGFFAAVWVKN